MKENKNKKNSLDNSDNNEILKEEMEELARIFREELGKAREEAEEDEAEEITEEELDKTDYEVEGYAVTKGEKKKVAYKEEELCECCGERPRGTARDPHSPFCKECAAIMEKYPYDWKGIAMLLVSLAVLILSFVTVFEITPIFANFKRGNEALEKQKLYSAIAYYGEAETYILDEQIPFECKGLINKEIVAYFELGYDDVVDNAWLVSLQLIENNYDTSKKINNKEIAEIYSDITNARATVFMLGEHNVFEMEDYKKANALLESLLGKKIYITDIKDMSDGKIHDELDEDYAPTGEEKVTTYDEGWIRFYQWDLLRGKETELKYMIKYAEAKASEEKAETDSEEAAIDIESVKKTLEEVQEAKKVAYENLKAAPTNYERYIAPYLIEGCLEDKEFDIATAATNRIGNRNKEAIVYFEYLAKLSRYKDGNYENAFQICNNGIETVSYAKGGTELVPIAASILSMEKAVNLIMLNDAQGAYEAITECYNYQTEYYSMPRYEVRDLYAILALASGNNEDYEALEKDVKENVELQQTYDFSSYVYDYKDHKISLKEIIKSGDFEWRFKD